MSAEDNKAVVGRWFAEFWGTDYNPRRHRRARGSRHPLRVLLARAVQGRDEVRDFAAKFRAAFPDLGFEGTAGLIAEGDCVVGQWKGGGTHTGPAFDDLPIGSLAAASGKKMHFTGITVLRVKDGLIVEELGLDDGVTVLEQLGLVAQG